MAPRLGEDRPGSGRHGARVHAGRGRGYRVEAASTEVDGEERCHGRWSGWASTQAIGAETVGATDGAGAVVVAAAVAAAGGRSCKGEPDGGLKDGQ